MKYIFLLISLLFLAPASLAQEENLTNQEQHPKIGLVLSGGGAKGLAHIGVLKVIDSLGIKIDYIGGTSMGAIIGGLYASGYTAKQLDSIFSNVDTDALIQDYIPRGAKNFYEKRNDEIYAITLPFDKFRLGLPTALSKGLYNYNLLSRLTFNVCGIQDFKDLPIPFFCIATNVETGKEVILDSGSLPQAIIASGAIPSLYNPIEIDGKLLIDGGIVNNYPVELLREKGMDIIIGVDVQDGLKSREDLKGASSVLLQVNNLGMIQKMQNKRKLTDVYIKPDIRNYNMMSFDEGYNIILKGIEAATIKEKELVKLVPEKPIYREPLKVMDSLVVSDIEINQLQDFTRAYVRGKLKFKTNVKISFDDIVRGIDNLNATQNFKTISYNFTKGSIKGTKQFNLFLQEKEKTTFLKFGLHYDDLLKSSILINYTKKKFLTKNDVFSFDFILGDNVRYNLNYYIDNGFYWSFGFNSKMISFNRNIPNDFNNGLTLTDLGLSSINVDFTDISNQIYLQTIFAQKFSIGGGGELKFLKIKSENIGNTNPVFEDNNYFSVFGYAKYDSFDNRYFPKRGWYFNGELKSFIYSSDDPDNFQNFTIAKADMGFAKTFYKKATIKLQCEGGFKVGDKSINYFDFVLGGYGFAPIVNFRPFYGYDFVSLMGDSYVKSSATLDVEVYRKHHLNFTGNFANIGNNLFQDVDNWLKKPAYTGYAIGYGLETIIGPIEIKHSWAPETRDHFTWFTVGFWF
ncbi:patatin-like phospholipase family protein [Flavobacterium sp. NRK F10]|uniref:patatin-like phospholipase family protein n=1 Tax=Flavobacterium sp. NRK F10 TaxID=2954931 RepID=UPI0020913C00|nr:patatin-like phospholipase family protein [Flavobacterium sp. NRK F10]MCO6174626.1 patatin-like phospholipase family protein [Flavobacterium sp. NRK F10]